MPSPSKVKRDTARAAARSRFLSQTVQKQESHSATTDSATASAQSPAPEVTTFETMTDCASQQKLGVEASGSADKTAAISSAHLQSVSCRREFDSVGLNQDVEEAQVLKNLKLEDADLGVADEEDTQVGESCDESENDCTGPLPLYADDMAPRPQSLVVVCCQRVDDDSGVWGSLPEWTGMAEAYLPPGSIAEGKKKQKKFLTVAKRRMVHFVAVVVEVDEIYDERSDELQYHITLDRRPISETEETAVLDRWHQSERAGRLVDAASRQAGMSRSLARQLVLYPCYRHFMPGCVDSLGLHAFLGDNGYVEPEEAAVKFLDRLGHPAAVPDSLLQAMNLKQEFAKVLVECCRIERLRVVRPRSLSQTHEVRPPLGEDGILAMRAAVAAAEKLPPPEGCSALQVTIDGAGRYKFLTTCTEDDDEVATGFLAKALECVQAKIFENRTLAKSQQMPETVAADLGPAQSSPEGQPILSIGLIGDVAHGKSTLCKALTGKRTRQHSSEHKNHGATIRLGYANCCVCRCTDPSCPPPACFSTAPDDANIESACKACGSSVTVLRRVSFVDCPGHADLMATMLAGASVFDAAILVASANTPCPSPQAAAHINALAMAGHSLFGKIAIVQSKADLLFPAAEAVNEKVIIEQLEQHASKAADAFRGGDAEGAPMFPLAVPHGVGLDAVAMWLASLQDRPASALAAVPHMHCLRSWDINYPGERASEIQGGVIGGALVQGILRTGDIVEVRPGTFTEHTFVDKKHARRTHRSFTVEPLLTRIETAKSGDRQLAHAGPGGLIALGTTLCPSFSANDRLQGCILGLPGTLPPVWELLSLDSIAAVREASARLQVDDEDSDVQSDVLHGSTSAELDRIKPDDEVCLHVGSDSVKATVLKIRLKHSKLTLSLHMPLCAALHSNVAIEVQRGHGYHLVAHGRIADGTECRILEPCADKFQDGTSIDCAKQATKCHESTNLSAQCPTTSKSCQIDENAGMEVDADASLKVSDGIELDLHEPELLRERFFDELSAKMGGDGSAGDRIKIPPPEILREGGAHCIWKNFMRAVTILNRPAAHFLSFLAAEGFQCHRAGEVALLKYTWVQQKKKPLAEALEEVRKGESVPTEEWGRCLCIITKMGRQFGMSPDLDLTKEHFPVEVSLKNAVLRIGSRGLGGPVKISAKLCGLIRAYARTYVTCHQCRSTCTLLVRDRKMHHTKTELVCSKCSARRFVSS